jgi:hypothetical protein
VSLSLDHVEGAGGNWEVPPHGILGVRGDLSGAWAEADTEEGGTRGKHGFARGSARNARDVIEAYLGTGALASG